MPKPAAIQSDLGQRAAVAVFMAMLLAVSTLLAYGATYRPAVPVTAAGLTLDLPAAWSPVARERGPWTTFTNDRRTTQELRVFALPIDRLGLTGQRPALDNLVRWCMWLAQMPLPADASIRTTTANGLDAAVWSGVTRQRGSLFRRPTLGLISTAVVTDGDGRYWALILEDENFPHEDAMLRLPEQAAEFGAVLETVAPAATPEPAPDPA